MSQEMIKIHVILDMNDVCLPLLACYTNSLISLNWLISKAISEKHESDNGFQEAVTPTHSSISFSDLRYSALTTELLVN